MMGPVGGGRRASERERVPAAGCHAGRQRKNGVAVQLARVRGTPKDRDNSSAARQHDAAELAERTTPTDAVNGADVVLLAVPWMAVADLLPVLAVADAIVIDATNHLGTLEDGRSGAEQIASGLGSSRVIKAFNTTGSGNMADPSYPAGAAMMAVAGDDDEAKATVLGLAESLGFAPLDAGPLSAARDLEAIAELWVRLALKLGHGPNIAFALMRR